MAEEELTRCVVDNGSGKCKASSADASDDVPVAVPSSLSTLKSLSTRKRPKWGGSAFEERFIVPIMYEAFPLSASAE